MRMPLQCWVPAALLVALAGCVTPRDSARRVGEVFSDCRDCPQLVVVPAGAFMMRPGAAGPPGAAAARLPAPHRVEIAQAFAVGRFEITRAQYARFVADTGYRTGAKCFIFQDVGADGVGVFNWVEGKSWRDPGYRQTDRDPVVCVSWEDAHAYLDWLSRSSGHRYRLLSESEWAYATSAGSGQLQWWGADSAQSCRYANSADQSFQRAYPALRDVAACSDGYAFTAPVGSFRPNAFGLHDLLGNAWEWTEDCGGGDFSRAPTDGSPSLIGQCGNRVRRSGSWYRPTVNDSSALPAADWHGNAGFRVARELTAGR